MEWLKGLTPFPFAIGVSGPMPETMRRVVLKQTSAKMGNAQLVRQPLTPYRLSALTGQVENGH